MIAGIGTDIVAVARLDSFYQRHGQRALEKLCRPGAYRVCWRQGSGRFQAKRFAANEAFGKALGIGLVAPATLPSIGINHDALGRPLFEYATALAAHLAQRRLIAHLSISDERDYAIAFVILEQS
ncbi:MAG: holo-ACP synthase [Candidatus Accumulibacter sp.]|uniref:holo-ACP synthase n=1 Tax=Accumulibacter sp. TaxID=2053492 RepID=UPI0025894DD9|nr:holo-ACP synthase [Accumulibacter sp.]MBK8115675.1 holo-ACP synthase [Accumulibacter sp.]